MVPEYHQIDRHQTWSRISPFVLVPELTGHALDAPEWIVLEVGNDSAAT
jgi:hypothetical protein